MHMQIMIFIMTQSRTDYMPGVLKYSVLDCIIPGSYLSDVFSELLISIYVCVSK